MEGKIKIQVIEINPSTFRGQEILNMLSEVIFGNLNMNIARTETYSSIKEEARWSYIITYYRHRGTCVARSLLPTLMILCSVVICGTALTSDQVI